MPPDAFFLSLCVEGEERKRGRGGFFLLEGACRAVQQRQSGAISWLLVFIYWMIISFFFFFLTFFFYLSLFYLPLFDFLFLLRYQEGRDTYRERKRNRKREKGRGWEVPPPCSHIFNFLPSFLLLLLLLLLLFVFVFSSSAGSAASPLRSPLNWKVNAGYSAPSIHWRASNQFSYQCLRIHQSRRIIRLSYQTCSSFMSFEVEVRGELTCAPLGIHLFRWFWWDSDSFNGGRLPEFNGWWWNRWETASLQNSGSDACLRLLHRGNERHSRDSG